MKKYNCGFKNIDLILITHLHGDHIIGLIGLLQTMGNSGKTDDLTIVGPIGIIDAMKAIKVLVEYLPYKVKSSVFPLLPIVCKRPINPIIWSPCRKMSYKY